MEAEVSPKSRLAVVLLAWFLGVFGAHRFYLGKTGTAILMLVTFGGLGIWALVDFVLAVAGLMEDREGRLIKNWEGATVTSRSLGIARERYAKGEITREDFEQIKRDLSQQ